MTIIDTGQAGISLKDKLSHAPQNTHMDMALYKYTYYYYYYYNIYKSKYPNYFPI